MHADARKLKEDAPEECTDGSKRVLDRVPTAAKDVCHWT